MTRQPSTRPTRREWLTALRDLVVMVAGAVFVLVALDQGLVLLATLAIEMGWAR